MDRHEAIIEKNWREHGLASLLVIRRRSDGSIDIGYFAVDVWCLGVREAAGEAGFPESDLEDYIAEHLPEDTSERIHPACAKKIIEGAVTYADRLGIAPHRDFRKARRVLSGIDASLCPTEFSFGREGRPCYVRGPDDSDERVNRVLAALRARCGEDGYDFEDDTAPEDQDLLDLREDLIAWLAAESEDVPRFYRLSGMVTALQICPQPVSPMKLFEALRGLAGPDWDNRTDLPNFTTMLTDYWNYVRDLVHDHVAPNAAPDSQAIDIWWEDFPKETGLPFAAATIEWAGGFMHTTELWPEAWGDALQRPELAEHWEIVRWWTEFIGTGNKDRIADAAEADPPRTIAASVTVLIRALRPLRSASS